MFPDPDGNHVYVDAPVTLVTTDEPLQIVVLVIDVAIVGVLVTLTVIVLFELHPEVVPVTVYDAVVVGVTAITVVVCEPGNHAYVVAPLAVNVAVCPAHMVVDDAVILTVGFGVTVTVTFLTALVQAPVEPVIV